MKMGEYRISVDQRNKLVKVMWEGRLESGVLEKGCNEWLGEIRKFPKGMVLAMSDVSKVDMKSITPEMAKITHDTVLFAKSYCRKAAEVVPSPMLMKASKESGDAQRSDRYKVFATEHEAIRYLLFESTVNVRI